LITSIDSEESIGGCSEEDVEVGCLILLLYLVLTIINLKMFYFYALERLQNQDEKPTLVRYQNLERICDLKIPKFLQ
jgi:hypothetical protein